MPTSTPTPTLLTLPEEITVQILHHITARPTLHALTLVSTTLNRLSTPLLYAHLALHADAFMHLRPLACLLWSSERHRACVRSVSVRRAYGGNLVPWPGVGWAWGRRDGGGEGEEECEGKGEGETKSPTQQHDPDDRLAALIQRQIALYVRDGDHADWYARVRYGDHALPIASLLLRSLPRVGVMQFDGFMLVDPAVRV